MKVSVDTRPRDILDKILRSIDKDIILIAQCCDCGVMLSGPNINIVFLKPDGSPDLSIGETHGMCHPCADKKLAAWKKKRACRLQNGTLSS